MSLGVLLAVVGYGWRTDECAGCKSNDDLVFFSIRRGQVVCLPCGRPYERRLIPITEHIFKIMQKLVWPPPLGLLSVTEQALVYGIAVTSLVNACGKELVTDQPFRDLVGAELFDEVAAKTVIGGAGR